MSKNKKKNGKIEQDTIRLCDGVRLLNHPEITYAGRDGAANPYTKNGKHRFFWKRSKQKTSIGSAERSDSRGVVAKSLLILFITAGTMLGFLSAIDLVNGGITILASYLLMSFYFCSLFRSGKLWVRDVGYVVFLVVFVLFIMIFRTYVNSGFYAMINQFLDKVTDYYGAEEVKVFSETIENRIVTVPIAAIALGVIPIIILNIFLNTYMSVLWTVTFSLPLFILPLFFRLEPDGIYMFMVFVGILGVLCLKGNGHFRITDRQESFEYNSGKKRLTYRHSDRASRQVIACAAAVCVLTVGITMIVKPIDSYLYRYQDSSAKDKIEEPLGNLIMYGVESLWNSYNVGGLANGQLGRVSDVTFDDETDLTIRFVPYSSDTIYLKSFVGDTYSVDHWDRDEEGLYPTPDARAAQRMDITTEFDLGNAPYYPYYTVYDTELGEMFRSMNLSAMPAGQSNVERVDGRIKLVVSYTTDMTAESALESVDEKYLYVPDVNLSSVQAFCEAAGVQESDSAQEKIEKVYARFYAEYPYTLHPGATPRDEDYVNYFLDTTKKGLCANYATAGALILRYLGIPTRYVEGYAAGYEDVLEGNVVEQENLSVDVAYADYYIDGEVQTNLPVMDVELTDHSAHAWIEAFIDGRWQVVELTPPSDEEDEESQEDFWTRLARLLSGDDSTDAAGDTSENSTSFSLSRNMWILYIVFGLVGCACLIAVLFLAVHKMLRFAGYHRRRDKTANIIAYYKYLCDYMRLADDEFDRADSHLAQLKRMCPDGEEESLFGLASYMEALAYGSQTCGEEYADIKRKLRGIFKKRKRRVPFLRRVYIFRKL